jgi:hypothetical protein
VAHSKLHTHSLDLPVSGYTNIKSTRQPWPAKTTISMLRPQYTVSRWTSMKAVHHGFHRECPLP